MTNENSDLQKLKALLNEFGVGFEESGQAIVCEEGHNKVVGYLGFSAAFEFDESGNFKQISLGES